MATQQTPMLTSHLRLLLTAFLMVLTVASIWWIYSHALPGRFLFDDSALLNQLQSIGDWKSALVFIISGDSGPLGRPLTLATFALQAAAWPDNPTAMLQVNFLIHLLATSAAFLLAFGLARIRLPQHPEASLWIGLGAAILWSLSPFLATTHLMVAQRLTSLSGFFVFLGLAAFVWAHLLATHRPKVATFLLVGGLGGGVFLATLAKENGALLPLLALVILWLWIPQESRMQRRRDQLGILLLGLIPGILVIAYLLQLVPGTLEQGYGAHRYFSPVERLMSQPAILLDYLRNLLAPRAITVTPFMDRLPVPAGWLNPPLTLGAVLFWLTLLAVAGWLRRLVPYVLFGVVFFLAGHLIESSIVGLELYFAHRNYVPAFGIYFALVFALYTIPQIYQRVIIVFFVAYTSLFALVLWQATTAWRDAEVSAELWHQENPHSERAVQFLASQYLARNDPMAARRVLDDATSRDPKLALIQIQRTQLCAGQEAEFPQLLAEVTDKLRKASYQKNAVTELTLSIKGEIGSLCASRDLVALAAMTNALLENPAYTNSSKGRADLLVTQAFISAESGDYSKAIDFFLDAFRLGNQIDNVFFAASLMINSQKHEKAHQLLKEVRDRAPSHPIQRFVWLERLETFTSIANASHAKTNPEQSKEMSHTQSGDY